MVWYSHLFKNFPQIVVINIVKGFCMVNKAEVGVFLEFSCFFYHLTNIGSLISGRGKTIPGRGKGMLMDQRRGWGVHVCIVYMGDCKDRASDTESSRGNSREMRTRKASIPYS